MAHDEYEEFDHSTTWAILRTVYRYGTSEKLELEIHARHTLSTCKNCNLFTWCEPTVWTDPNGFFEAST